MDVEIAHLGLTVSGMAFEVRTDGGPNIAFAEKANVSPRGVIWSPGGTFASLAQRDSFARAVWASLQSTYPEVARNRT